MAVFLTLMLIGLGGLALMALPGLTRRTGAHPGGHGVAPGHGGVHTATHAGALRGPGAGVQTGAHSAAHVAGATSAGGFRHALSNLVPEPRAILSLLMLYGAWGYFLEGGLHLSHRASAWIAFAPAILVELALVRPLWKLALKFQGKEASPLEWVVAESAEAVTAFRNGKGIVRVIHDGRSVQLTARLIPEQAEVAVSVGDSLRIEDIDTGKERVTVSLNTSPLMRNDS